MRYIHYEIYKGNLLACSFPYGNYMQLLLCPFDILAISTVFNVLLSNVSLQVTLPDMPLHTYILLVLYIH